MTLILGSIAFLSLGLAAWQCAVAWRFALHQRRPIRARAWPGVTVLKPIKGCDTETEECLRSWFEQDYHGPVQVLFGVASDDDPAVPLIRRLIEAHPNVNAELLICARDLGVNAKVSTLIQVHQQSAHEFICVSDADVFAPQDFLTQSITALEDERVGLVNSFYELRPASGLGPRWEALAINADFWSQVLQSASLKPIDFALGAAMVFRRAPFDQTGGFRPFADRLADDYHLGRQFAGTGLAIALSPIVVECRSQEASFVAAWRHQLRWARTIRVCQRWPYFLSILSNATLWPMAWWIAAPSTRTALMAISLLSLRSIQAVLLDYRLTRRWHLITLGMAWVKDVLQVGMWALAFLGKTVSWRGTEYRVDSRGNLARIGVADAGREPGPPIVQPVRPERGCPHPERQLAPTRD